MPSDYVRSTVVESFDIAAERVVVVPHGVDRPSTWTDEATLRRRHHLGDRRFVVYPAITHPHKNHRLLLELLAGPWSDPDLVLVLLGGAGAADADVAAAIRDTGLAARVIRPGRVSDADRDGFVAGAEAVVFPSEYEGFGAPVLEAMVLGTPVLSSDRAALPEVVGDAGLVRPPTVEAWADGLDEIAARRDELVGRRTATRGVVQRRPVGGPPGRRLSHGGRLTMRIVVLGPHFEPDTAPTGRVLTAPRRGTGGARPRAARRRRTSVVPGPRRRGGLARSPGAA